MQDDCGLLDGEDDGCLWEVNLESRIYKKQKQNSINIIKIISWLVKIIKKKRNFVYDFPT